MEVAELLWCCLFFIIFRRPKIVSWIVMQSNSNNSNNVTILPAIAFIAEDWASAIRWKRRGVTWIVVVSTYTGLYITINLSIATTTRHTGHLIMVIIANINIIIMIPAQLLPIPLNLRRTTNVYYLHLHVWNIIIEQGCPTMVCACTYVHTCKKTKILCIHILYTGNYIFSLEKNLAEDGTIYVCIHDNLLGRPMSLIIFLLVYGLDLVAKQRKEVMIDVEWCMVVWRQRNDDRKVVRSVVMRGISDTMMMMFKQIVYFKRLHLYHLLLFCSNCKIKKKGCKLRVAICIFTCTRDMIGCYCCMVSLCKYYTEPRSIIQYLGVIR